MRERGGGKVLALIPLDLDGFLFNGWQGAKRRQVQSRIAADFTTWQPPDDGAVPPELPSDELERVIRALRADAGARELPSKPKL